ncbi:ABC transporter permease [Acidipropionibacterium jensenii]|uniref:ABC transporter permease n=1 Tax=Acidipropionibacterium jensenii TaxID=1749 RepID=UPI000BC316BC|nr:ABC transporter permease [Acidipropionibacterium jensenii]AZZ42047.1 ABC transporter permease [Acidipropionibacterium jensenii]
MNRVSSQRRGAVRTAARPLVGVAAWAATLVVVCLAVYLLLAVLPGDVASQRLGVEATAGSLAHERHLLGLDTPVLLRFGGWLAGVLHGDLGTMLATGEPVSAVITGPLERSAVLLVLGCAGILICGVGGGVLAGTRAGSRTDRALSGTALTMICVPELVVGTFLVLVLAIWLGWLPAVSLVPLGGSILSRPAVLVLPVTTLVMIGSGMLLRQVRALVCQQAERPHVEAARLAGLPESVVWRSHLLPGIAVPIAQACSAIVPYLVGGSVVVERVFAFPGLGTVLVAAVSNREPNLLMACVLVIVGLTLMAYLFADSLRRRNRV